MAQALECPACGMRHRLDGLVPESTFRCERCSQKLLVPAAILAAPATTSVTTIAPPPRRRVPGPSAPTAAPHAPGAGVTVTLPADGEAPPRVPPDSAPARGPRPDRRKGVAWYWRLVAWIVAIPLGSVLAVLPSYEFGLISKDDIFDVFVGSGNDRYARLALVTVVWAVVTAVLVQLFIEGGRWWAARHRRHSTGRDRPRDSTMPVVSS